MIPPEQNDRNVYGIAVVLCRNKSFFDGQIEAFG